MVGPGDDRAQGCICFSINGMHDAHSRVEHGGPAGIADQRAGTRQVLRKTQTGRPQSAGCLHNRCHDIFLHHAHISIIHTTTVIISSPDTDQVRRLVIMRAADDRVIDLDRIRQHFAHIDDVIVHKADGIEGDDGDARLAVVDDHGACPEVVMYAGCRTAFVKTGDPYRIKSAVIVAVLKGVTIIRVIAGVAVDIGPGVYDFGCDRHCGCTDRERCLARADIHGELIVRMPVADVVHHSARKDAEQQNSAPEHNQNRFFHAKSSLSLQPIFWESDFSGFHWLSTLTQHSCIFLSKPRDNSTYLRQNRHSGFPAGEDRNLPDSGT